MSNRPAGEDSPDFPVEKFVRDIRDLVGVRRGVVGVLHIVLGWGHPILGLGLARLKSML